MDHPIGDLEESFLSYQRHAQAIHETIIAIRHGVYGSQTEESLFAPIIKLRIFDAVGHVSDGQ